MKVWLDAGKTRDETRDELRPALLTHRCTDILEDLEREKGAEGRKVTKDLRGKNVKVGDPGTRAGYSLYGKWRWTFFATSRYSEEELEMATAFIEGR